MRDKTYRMKTTVIEAFEILSYVAKNNNATAEDVASGVRRSYGTVMEYLVTLEKVGALKQDAGGWQIGMALAVYWSKVKTIRENEIRRAQADLNEIGV